MDSRRSLILATAWSALMIGGLVILIQGLAANDGWKALIGAIFAVGSALNIYTVRHDRGGHGGDS